MKPEILIPTNGFKGTLPAIEQGIWLAKILDSAITLLGVTERLGPAAIDDRHPLEEVFDQAIGLFRKNGAEYRLEVRRGSAEEVIPRRASQGDCIVVLGPLGRPPFRRWLAGRSVRYFIEEIEQPILYVPQSKLPMKKILICVGGLGYEVTAEHLAMQIAMKSRAGITLLHIVPPVDLDYPTARAIRENWRHPEETDTPIGQSLRQALEAARSNGLSAEVRGRQGNVVEEIRSEAKEGKYDLLCMGSSYSVHSLRQMYSPNVTAEIVEGVDCPVLTARYRAA
jgi:nucleotide-binding universal stress UspA family protein